MNTCNTKTFSHRFMLTELENLQLKLLIKDLPKIELNRKKIDTNLLAIIHQYSSYLPQRLGLFLFGFRHQSNNEGAVLIQNLPITECAKEETHHSEWLLMLLISSIADLTLDQNESNYIPQITPPLENKTTKDKQDYTAFYLRQGEILLIDNEITTYIHQTQEQNRYSPSISGIRDIRRKRKNTQEA